MSVQQFLGPAVLRWAPIPAAGQPTPSTPSPMPAQAAILPPSPTPETDRLGPVDRSRAALQPEPRRQRFLLGRTLLNQVVSEHFGRGRVDTGPCAHCGGPHGGVVISPGTAVGSLSYTASTVVVAAASSTLAVQLGVDIVRTHRDPARDQDLAHLLNVAPSLALRRWAEVEAVLKAAGQGLRLDPRTVAVSGNRAWLKATGQSFNLAELELPGNELVVLAWQPARG